MTHPTIARYQERSSRPPGSNFAGQQGQPRILASIWRLPLHRTPHAKFPARCCRFLLAFAKRAARRERALRPLDGLRTPAEAAAKLRCSIKTLNGHVAAGVLKYVSIGHGTKRPRKMFTDADLDTFIAAQTREAFAMSVYRPAKRHTGISTSEHRGHRFHGSTKCTTRREAEKIEVAEREKAKAHVAAVTAAKTSLRLDDVADRYWLEIGQHHAGADTTEHRLALLVEFLGPGNVLTDITGDDVAKLVAWRRGHRVRKTGPLISAFTVNHTTEQLKKLFTRAKAWGVRFQHEPRWRDHWLKVPSERVRELADDEAARLDAALRDDYRPFFEFAHASGLRLNECLLRWSEVDWNARKIRKLGKGDKPVTAHITSSIRDVLWPLRGHHPVFVFTYIAQRIGKGERRPVNIFRCADVLAPAAQAGGRDRLSLP